MIIASGQHAKHQMTRGHPAKDENHIGIVCISPRWREGGRDPAGRVSSPERSSQQLYVTVDGSPLCRADALSCRLRLPGHDVRAMPGSEAKTRLGTRGSRGISWPMWVYCWKLGWRWLDGGRQRKVFQAAVMTTCVGAWQVMWLCQPTEYL